MGKEKVTLTLDAGQLEDLRRIAGARSLSAAVDTAVAAYLARLRHLASVDEWLAELEREHGPIPSETLEWAARLVEEWDEPTYVSVKCRDPDGYIVEVSWEPEEWLSGHSSRRRSSRTPRPGPAVAP